MGRLNRNKLHVRLSEGMSEDAPIVPRRYTLTHSDTSGQLLLTIGPEYEARQIGGWYTRLMRDEVLAEWQQNSDGFSLHVHCHVSGGFVLGTAGWRFQIFQHELPLVLEALRAGDEALFLAHPELDVAPIIVHFHAQQERYNRVENWRSPADYKDHDLGRRT